MVIAVIVVVLAGFLLLWWEIRQLDAKVEKAIGELIEVKTHLADISEEMSDRRNEDDRAIAESGQEE